MRDGFYLSTYVTPPGGVSAALNVWERHDQNATLWKLSDHELTLVSHWEFERSTGVKHDGRAAPDEATAVALIESRLETHALTFDDLVCTWGTPGLPKYQPTAWPQTGTSNHSIAHIMSGVALSPALLSDQVIALAIDGGPDEVEEPAPATKFYAGASINHGCIKYCAIESPGGLFDIATTRLGLAQGSLMALAAATDRGGDADVDLSEFDGYTFWGPEAYDNAREILPILEAKARAGFFDDVRFTPFEQFAGAVSRLVQDLAYLVLRRSIARVVDLDNLETSQCLLSLTGGVALNCPNNTRLMKEFGFRSFMTPPWVNDGGQAIGRGLVNFLAESRESRLSWSPPGAYLGSSDSDISGVLADFGEHIVNSHPMVAGEVVDDLIAGPIVWFDGREEVGPRALGHRSLLADPRDTQSRERLNAIKQRQWWRPVAPVVLEEYVHEWFVDGRSSPYMLETFDVLKGKEDVVPAVVHLDGSARIQTLNVEQDHDLWTLLDEFRKRTGVPILCNTSLNDRGEPIIATCVGAAWFALRKGLSVVYVNGTRLQLTAAGAETRSISRPCQRTLDIDAEQRAALRDSVNPHGIVEGALLWRLFDARVSAKYDLSDASDARRLERAFTLAAAMDPRLPARLVWRSDARPQI